MNVQEYLKQAEQLAKLDAAHKLVTKGIRARVTNYESEMKIDIKSNFDVDLSSKKKRVVLSDNFRARPRILGLEQDKDSFPFTFRKEVHGKVSLRPESITKPHFRITFNS